MADQISVLRAVIDGSGLSRRKAFAAIRDGRVTLDGVPVVDPSSPFESGILSLDQAPVGSAGRRVYLLLNKPPGYLSTVSDPHGRRTVLGLVPRSQRVPGLHPVGRLDLDTSGLLILTNDGGLTYRLTHPRHEVEKEYWVALEREPTDAQLDELRRGVEIDGQVRRPAGVERLGADAAPYQIAVRLKEGRKRQVRRMLLAVGSFVSELRRVREGPLRLGDLPEGELRTLSRREVELLLGGEGPSRPAPSPGRRPVRRRERR